MYMYYVHFRCIKCYVTNLVCCTSILGYIGISVYYLNCYVTCNITYCICVLKDYVAML